MRKQEREQLKHDRFTETAAETMHWAVEHRSKLILIGAIVGTILLASLGGWAFINYRSQQAQIALQDAMRTFNAPVRDASTPANPSVQSFASSTERAKAAQQQFQAVADKYSITHQADIARYLAAVAAMDAGDTGAAEKQLTGLANSRTRDIASLSKFALASFYATSGKDQEAVRLYKQLIDNPTAAVPKTTAQMSLADHYSAKQPAEARRIYEEISKSNPQTLAAQMAQSKMQQLP